MLLPAKHIRVSESLLALGSFLLQNLDAAQTPDELWDHYTTLRRSGAYPAHHSFDNLILALDVLYALGLVELRTNGKVARRAAR